MQLFLKYSPDSLTRLFDRCLTKPCMAQVKVKIKTNPYYVCVK